jgi:hypothetical protein
VRSTLLVVTLALLLPSIARAQQKPVDAKPAVIRGTITAADTGKPLRRARVALVPVAGGTGAVPLAPAFTNSLGRYELRDVPAGRYYVSARRAGFVDIQYGQRHVGEQGLAVDAASGGAVSNIDIAMPRGSVLSGRITDDLGEPYPGVRVDVLALRYNRGKREPFPVSLATTDDAGQFRVAGLPPGRYYLSATSNETWRNAKGETLGFPTLFYPGVPMEQAQVITVGASEVKSDLNFSVQAGRAARIRGRVQRETGEPVTGSMVGLSYSFPGAIVVAGGRTTRTAADGSFEFRDVPGGVYNISDQTVVVTGVDIDDVLIVSKTGSTVIGSMVGDDGGPPPFNPSGVRVLLEAPTGKVLPTVRVVAVDQDWSFRLNSLGGPFLFRLLGLPDGWVLGSVKLDDKEITDVPWDVPTGGKQFGGLRITVTQRAGRVVGTVLDTKGRPTSSATVIVFSEDADTWIPYSRFIRVVRPAADGQFSVTGLPAGTYRAVARSYIESGQYEDRAFLESIRDEGVRIVLGDGASESVTLRVR